MSDRTVSQSPESASLTLSHPRTIIQTRTERWEGALDPGEVARLAVDLASDKQAEDIIMLDIRPLTGFADYFVIMSAESGRQLEALQEDLVKALKDSGVSLHHREGTAQGGWILLDYSDVIIHLFGTEEREYFHLEQLWSAAAQVVRVL